MPPDGESTRDALIDAATVLFAEHGIEMARNEAIIRMAGARNSSAVSYHFGDRKGLLKAVLERHQTPIDARRRELLAEPADPGQSTLERLATISIDPLVEHLVEPRGPEYIRIRAELLNRGDLDVELEQAPLITEAAGRIDLTAAERFARYQREFATAMIFGSLADFARRHPDAGAGECREFGRLLRGAMVAIGQLTPSDAMSGS